MLNDNSAQLREETLHTATSTSDNFNDRPKDRISEALRCRAESLLNDKAIDATVKAAIRYCLVIDDPYVSELLRRADAGEPIIDQSLLQTEEAN